MAAPAALVLGAVVVPVTALAVIGGVSWRRTASLRHGRIPAGAWQEPGSMDAPAPTSRTTLIPAFAGASLALAAMWTGAGPAPMVAGVAVLAAGFGTRVTALGLDRDGLHVAWRLRRRLSIAWPELREVRPPRWPLGGWALRFSRGAGDAGRMLMPSDLLGNERVLAAAVARGGLAFDGRTWGRPR